MFTARPFPDTRPSLLEAVRCPDDDAGWNAFYQAYAPAVFRVACQRGVAPPEAEDIVQQVMLTLSRHLPTFQYRRDRGRFRAWVQRITETKIIDALRRSQRQRQGSTRAIPADNAACLADNSWQEMWEREWKLQDIVYCLRDFRRDVAPRTLEAFQLYVIEGRTAQEVAERLDMSVNQVYVIRHQLLARLRDRLEALGKLEA